MAIQKLKDLAAYCKDNNITRRMAVIKPEDDHTLTAVMQAVDSGVIQATLVGDKPAIQAVLKQEGYETDACEIIDVKGAEEATLKAIGMVHKGEADYLMKGTLETKTLMSLIVAKGNGMRTDRLMSQVSIMELPNYHKLIALSDSALNPKPNADQKRQIILNAVDIMHNMGVEKPKVAVLAASETVNPKLQESTDGAALKEMWQKGEIPGCIVEGPISLDLSLEEESVRIKNYGSPVGGDADMLVCPDLASGNMMGKGMLFCGAKSAGIIVGSKVPVVLCSRAATIEDKYYSILLGAIAAGSNQ